MGGREKIFGVGAFYLLLWPGPVASPRSSQPRQRLLGCCQGGAVGVFTSTHCLCKLRSSINREVAVKCALSAGTESHQMEWEPGDKCSVLWPSGNSCQGTQPGMCNLPDWVNNVGVISALMPGYGAATYYFLHLLLGCVWTKTSSTDRCKDLAD